jgi:DNA-binding SARP family transcriptional activator
MVLARGLRRYAPAGSGREGAVGHGVGFRLLGPVDVTVDGRAVEIGSAKQRALLAVLALRVGTVVPVEVLVDDLWGESPPAAVAGTLQSLVSRLRRIGARLRSRDGGYVLEAAPTDVDAVRFGQLVSAGRRSLAAADARAAADALTSALELWRGAAFGDLADRPFARDEARRLEEGRLGAV